MWLQKLLFALFTPLNPSLPHLPSLPVSRMLNLVDLDMPSFFVSFIIVVEYIVPGYLCGSQRAAFQTVCSSLGGFWGSNSGLRLTQ